MLDADTPAAREAIFRAGLVEPFDGMVKVMGGGDGLASFRQWGMWPEQFAGESRATMARVVDALAGADAWSRAAASLEVGKAAFAPISDRLRSGSIVFGLVLADLGGTPEAGGYSGFGGVPGWIMTVYGTPDEHNLRRVEAATVHELLHNVHFAVQSFNPLTATVGQYMVAEGLAESFSAELYGEEMIGPWVTAFEASKFEEARATFRGALERTGFGVIRGYIFGDAIATRTGLPAAGVPTYAGYALGYRLVQQYLKRAGHKVADALFVPWQEIVSKSGFFD